MKPGPFVAGDPADITPKASSLSTAGESLVPERLHWLRLTDKWMFNWSIKQIVCVAHRRNEKTADSVFVSVCMSVSLFLFLSLSLSLSSIYLGIKLSIRLPYALGAFLFRPYPLPVSVCLFVGLSVHLCVYLAVLPSVHPSVRLSINPLAQSMTPSSVDRCRSI